MPKASDQRKTKAKATRRPASQSQSQLQRSLRSNTTHHASLTSFAVEQPTETQTQAQTLSLATLPPSSKTKYQIVLSLLNDHSELPESELQKAYVKGQEILSDGWRRDIHLEGRLSDLRGQQRQRHRRTVRLPTRNVVESSGKASFVNASTDDILWYTAGLSYPCVCSLPRLKYAYTPSHPPVISTSLEALPPLSNSISHPQITHGKDLLPWSESGEEESDLDPSLDKMEEFQYLWRDALLRQTSVIEFDDLNEDQERDSQATTVEVISTIGDKEVDGDEALLRRLRKGKFRAVFDDDSAPLVAAAAVTSTTSVLTMIDSSNSELRMIAEENHNADTERWIKDAKRRKQWWRKEIKNDKSYGSIWSFLPVPYTHTTRYIPRSKKRKKSNISLIPEYRLFRAYSTLTHPFHPDLSSHIRRNPSSRVYWIIPLHGPILLPSLNHPLDMDKDKGKEKERYEGIPTPSRAFMSNTNEDGRLNSESKPVTVQVKAKPAALRWTRDLLLSFISTFLHPLHTDEELPLGRISYMFSGPKPDPFIDLPIAPPLSPLSSQVGGQSRNRNPIRPESGDHLRIYCDAKYALSLRTWLHNVHIPLTPLTPKVDNHNHDGELDGGSFRMFYKTRLVLAGTKGEVLIVA